jgi:hypothetical protein
MTKPDDASEPKAELTARKSTGLLWRAVFYLILTAFLLMLVAAVRYGLIGLPGGEASSSPVERVLAGSSSEEQGARDGDRSDAFEKRLSNLTARVEKLETIGAGATDERPVPEARGSEEVERIKANILSMVSGLSAVQKQLKHETQETGAVRSSTKTQVAMLAAFVQVSLAAESGRDFSAPLQALRRAAVHDSVVTAAVVRMEPFAASGLASSTALHEEFVAKEATLRAALRKADARTWKDRLLAELQRLVSIRPLHGPADGAENLGSIETDLTQHRLKAALDKVTFLPEAAQVVLKDWRAKVEARRTVDEALDSIAMQFAVQAQPEEKPATSAPVSEE